MMVSARKEKKKERSSKEKREESMEYFLTGKFSIRSSWLISSGAIGREKRPLPPFSQTVKSGQNRIEQDRKGEISTKILI